VGSLPCQDLLGWAPRRLLVRRDPAIGVAGRS